MQVNGQVNADRGSFQHSCVFETGLSYFHRMTVTVLQTTFHKLQPRKVNYSDYKKFDNDNFREYLYFRLVIANAKANDTSFLDFLKYAKKL